MIPTWSELVPESSPPVELPLPVPYEVIYRDTSIRGVASSVLSQLFGTPEVIFRGAYRMLEVTVVTTTTHQLALVDRIE